MGRTSRLIHRAATIPTPNAAMKRRSFERGMPMKTLFAVALVAFASPAIAQTAPAAPAAPAAAPAATSRLNLDTPIETIIADPKGKEVLTADMGMDVSQHPAYEQFKSMSLNQVAPMSGGKISDDVLKKVATDLAAIK
jgi:hypothetical protein